MQKNHKFHLLQSFLFLNFFLCTSISQQTDPNSCGKIQIQPPFLSSNPTGSFPLNHMILCRSQKLYFRTSIGLFPISKIDYTTKTLVISHSPSYSSSAHFVSPSLLSSGLPSPPELINSLLLHCSNPTKHFSEYVQNCTHLHKQEEEESQKTTCLIFEDVRKLNKRFHPNDLKWECSHYTRVYRNSSDFELRNGFKLGTVISFDIPDHLPNLCKECENPDGHCGVGLRCICHVLDCKDKVFSEGGIVRPGESTKKKLGRQNFCNLMNMVTLLNKYMILVDNHAKAQHCSCSVCMFISRVSQLVLEIETSVARRV